MTRNQTNSHFLRVEACGYTKQALPHFAFLLCLLLCQTIEKVPTAGLEPTTTRLKAVRSAI